MRQIAVEEAQALLSSATPPQLLDCRESWELDICKLPSAIHIPLLEVVERADELDRSRPVLVYCHAGIRSINAAVLLEQLGFTTMSMRGGTEAWAERIDPTMARY